MSVPPLDMPDSVPEITRAVTRGAARLLGDLGQGVLTEFSLVTGRRVDVIGIDRSGSVTIIEVKASVADFKGDRKWREYLEFCDNFYFAVAPEFPRKLLPEDECCGVIIADRFGAEILRQAVTEKLSAARRRAVTLRFARTAAQRLRSLIDPAP
jgi:hypothetical protein